MLGFPCPNSIIESVISPSLHAYVKEDYFWTNAIMINQQCLARGFRRKSWDKSRYSCSSQILNYSSGWTTEVYFRSNSGARAITWPVLGMATFWWWRPLPESMFYRFGGEHLVYFPSYTHHLRSKNLTPWACVHSCHAHLYLQKLHPVCPDEWKPGKLVSILQLSRRSWHPQVWTDACNTSHSPLLFINCDSISFHLFNLLTAKAC